MKRLRNYIEYIYANIRKHRLLAISLAFFFLFSFSIQLIAAPPSSPYDPGATLDPTCAPGDTNCTVSINQVGNSYDGATAGSLLFFDASQELAQNNDALYWDTTSEYLGIGTSSSPTASLHVNGTFRYEDGNAQADRVLRTDASGNATWVDVNTLVNTTKTLADVADDSTTSSEHLFTLDSGIPVEFETSANSPLLYLDESNGRVGVGDDSPTHALDVSGKVGINGTQVIHLLDQGSFPGSFILGDGGTNISDLGGGFHGQNNTFVGMGAGEDTTGGAGNTFIGSAAGKSNTTGYSNTAIGRRAFDANISGHDNAAIGIDALGANTTGDYNVAIGHVALWLNTSGNKNVAVGPSALRSNTGGSFNSAIGSETLRSNTSGNYNSAIGEQALYSNDTGSYNNAFGHKALYASTSSHSNVAMGHAALRNTSTGTWNVGVGRHAGFYIQTGTNNVVIGGDAAGYGGGSGTSYSNNVLIGYKAGFKINADNNVLIGYQAGDNITTGASNIIIGENVDAPSATGSNQINIGNTIYGDTSSTEVGIGTSSPNEALTVSGILSLSESSSPSATTGYGKLYPKGDNNLYYTDEAGTEYQLNNTFSNGLTESGGMVKLGGTLSEDTSIDGTGTYEIQFTNPSLFRLDTAPSGTGTNTHVIWDFTANSASQRNRFQIVDGSGSSNTISEIQINKLGKNTYLQVDDDGAAGLLNTTGNSSHTALFADSSRNQLGFYTNSASGPVFDNYVSLGAGTSTRLSNQYLTFSSGIGTGDNSTLEGWTNGDVRARWHSEGTWVFFNRGAGLSTTFSNSYSMYSSDRAGDGTATPHFETEDGNTVKLYQQDQDLLSLDNTGLTNFSGSAGVGTATLNSRFQIQGSGTTSSTSSLLIEDASGTDHFEVKDNGTIFSYNLSSGTGGAGYDAVCIDDTTDEITINTGGDDCVTSSARFKDDITSLDQTDSLDIIHDLNPVSFTYKNNQEPRIGLIAEEVNEIDDRLVFYEKDGTTPRGVRYQDITAHLLGAVQKIDVELQSIQSLDADDENSFLSRLLEAFKDLAVQFRGITTDEVQTERLCVGDTCVTEAELKELLKDRTQENTQTQTSTDTEDTHQEDSPVSDESSTEESTNTETTSESQTPKTSSAEASTETATTETEEEDKGTEEQTEETASSETEEESETADQDTDTASNEDTSSTEEEDDPPKEQTTTSTEEASGEA